MIDYQDIWVSLVTFAFTLDLGQLEGASYGCAEILPREYPSYLGRTMQRIRTTVWFTIMMLRRLARTMR